MSISVRDATIADSVQIAGLVSALGYPTSPVQMRKRLDSILSDDNYATTVACDGEQVVGFIGTRIGPLYESDAGYGQIMALAVARDRQRQGIGRLLMQAAESVLMGRDVSVLMVTSAISGRTHMRSTKVTATHGLVADTRRLWVRLASSPAAQVARSTRGLRSRGGTGTATARGAYT